MKVFLKESVPTLGNRHEVVDVKDGYARNYLFPKGLAEFATQDIIEKAEKMRVKREQEEAKRRAEIAATLKDLEEVRVTVTARADEEGTLYAAVGGSDVADALEEKGYEVSAEEVLFEGAVKSLGEHTVTLDFGDETTVDITLVVEQETAT